MSLHFMAEAAFDDLLTAWRAVDDMTRHRAHLTLREQDDRRRTLFAARRRMRKIRLALHPEPTERAAARASVLCETLDEVVHLTEDHIDPNRPGCYRCLCGELINANPR